MGVLDVLGSSSNPAVPSGNLTKALVIALLALLASRASPTSDDVGPIAMELPVFSPRTATMSSGTSRHHRQKKTAPRVEAPEAVSYP